MSISTTILLVAATITATATPQIISPGELSGPASENCLSFTPDGKLAVFDLGNKSSSTIVMSHRVRGAWSKPQVAPFSGQWTDYDPAVSPDGSFIVFASDRPKMLGGEAVGGLWRVDRKADGWGKAIKLPDFVNVGPRIYGPSIASDGSVYFTRQADDKLMHIYRSSARGATAGGGSSHPTT
jgi:hypothetical protein